MHVLTPVAERDIAARELAALARFLEGERARPPAGETSKPSASFFSSNSGREAMASTGEDIVDCDDRKRNYEKV